MLGHVDLSGDDGMHCIHRWASATARLGVWYRAYQQVSRLGLG